jgi:hypothetical protein
LLALDIFVKADFARRNEFDGAFLGAGAVEDEWHHGNLLDGPAR